MGEGGGIRLTVRFSCVADANLAKQICSKLHPYVWQQLTVYIITDDNNFGIIKRPVFQTGVVYVSMRRQFFFCSDFTASQGMVL